MSTTEQGVARCYIPTPLGSKREYSEPWTRDAKIFPQYHFFTLVNILSGHYLLMRSSDRRLADMYNLFTDKGEGPTRYMPPSLRHELPIRSSLETIGALRHR
jgi:hypothetical protein